MMKFVFYTYDGHGLPIAFKLQQEGYDVIVAQAKDLDYMPKEEPEVRRRRLMLYDGLLEKHDADKLTETLLKEPNKDEFFIVCDFNYLWKYAEQLKRAGFKGLLPSKEDFEFEENRQKAKEFVNKNYDIFAKEETQEFDTIDEAKEFLKQRTDKIWGVKGFNPEAPTFFPWSNNIKISHEELIDVLEKNKKLYESEGFILEEKIEDLIEFVPEIITFDKEILGMNIDIELKPFGPGNTAFQTGDSASMIFWLNEEDWEQFIENFFPVEKLYLRENEMVIWDAGVMYSPSRKQYYFSEFCFDPKTEVLTREGWKTYKEIKLGDEVLSINPRNGKLEWKPITRIVIKYHDGEMIRVGGDNHHFDALVTPDHQFWMVKNGKFKRFRANSLPKDSRWQIPRTGIWEGKDIPEIIIPAVEVKFPERIVKKGSWIKQRTGKKIWTRNSFNYYGVIKTRVREFIHHMLPELKFNTKDFCRFLGLWLAEGSYGSYYKNEPRTLVVAQSWHNSKRKEIENLLKKMNLNYKIAKNGSFKIHNRRLAKYFWDELGLKNVHSDSKFIPSFFKELAPQYLEEIILGFALGDGHWHKNQWVLSTTSKRLADDLQEIIHKTGKVANIKIDKKKGTIMKIKNREYIRKHDQYIISIRSKKINYSTNFRNVKKEYYKGIVWDVSVADNESLFVRRNGKAFFSSNCANRMGFNAIFNELSTFPYIGQYFEKIINKERLYDNNVMPFGCSIRIFNEIKDQQQKHLYIQDALIHADLDCKDVWLWDVYQKNGKLYTVGYDHNLAVITWASGDWKQTFKTIEAIIRSGKFFNYSLAYYRTADDILSENYPANITQRYNWIVENILQNPPKIEPFKDVENLLYHSNLIRKLQSQLKQPQIRNGQTKSTNTESL